MLFVSETFSLSPLPVLTTHEASLPWSKVSFPTIYLGNQVHLATLQPTRLLTYLLRRLHLHFLRSMRLQDVTRGEYFWSPPEIIAVVFAYTIFYTIEKLVLDRQLTRPKVVSLTRPALLKHFNGTVNHAGHIWSQQALVPSISVPSLQYLDWISLSGEWRLSCTPMPEITRLMVELVKYARKKGCTQKSDNRERQSQTLFFDYKHSFAWGIKSLGHQLFFDILYHSQSRLKFSNGLYTMKIVNWAYTVD